MQRTKNNVTDKSMSHLVHWVMSVTLVVNGILALRLVVNI